jgi:hypothetical protein
MKRYLPPSMLVQCEGYFRTASRGLTLGAGLTVLWLILGSHALFFTACTAILYSVVPPIVMMRSIDATSVLVLVKRQLVMMGKPDMVSVSLTRTRARSPLRYDVSLCLHGCRFLVPSWPPWLPPPSRPRLRANGLPIRASSQSSRQSSTGRPPHSRYSGSVKPLSRIFTMLDALPRHRRIVICLLRV